MLKYHGHVSFEKRGYDQNGKYMAHSQKINMVRTIFYTGSKVLQLCGFKFNTEMIFVLAKITIFKKTDYFN